MNPAPEVSRLANGVRVVSLHQPGRASAAAAIAWGGGAHAEGAGEAGLAHLAEHLLFPDDPDDLAAFDAMGGRVNAWSNHEYSVFHAHTSMARLPEAIGRLSRRLALGTDVVIEDDFQREREAIRRERFAEGDTALEQAHARCLGRPPPCPPADTLAHATPEALRRFIARELRGDALCVGVAGDLTHAEAVAASAALGELPTSTNASTATDSVPHWRGGLREALADGGPPGLLWLMPAPRRGTTEASALALAERALCGGLSAPLFRTLRARGLAYGLHSMRDERGTGGYWALQVVCLPAMATAVAGIVETTLNAATSGLAPDMLAAAWSALACESLLAGDDPAMCAEHLALSGLLGAPSAPAPPARPAPGAVRAALANAWARHACFVTGAAPTLSRQAPT